MRATRRRKRERPIRTGGRRPQLPIQPGTPASRLGAGAAASPVTVDGGGFSGGGSSRRSEREWRRRRQPLPGFRTTPPNRVVVRSMSQADPAINPPIGQDIPMRRQRFCHGHRTAQRRPSRVSPAHRADGDDGSPSRRGVTPRRLKRGSGRWRKRVTPLLTCGVDCADYNKTRERLPSSPKLHQLAMKAGSQTGPILPHPAPPDRQARSHISPPRYTARTHR